MEENLMTRTARSCLGLGGVIVVVLGALLGHSASSGSSTPSAPTTTTSIAATAPGTGSKATVLASLAKLQVKSKASMTGYSRSQFGTAWTDACDSSVPWCRNGLDTRNDILSRDLTGITCKTKATVKSKPHCTVATGTLADPYTGKTIHFLRGVKTSSAVQIDHVVPLGDAYATGAKGWTATKRTELANDPLNLIAVDGPTNEAKSDMDASSWLPPNKSFRCLYVARQIAVKAKYGLWVTSGEKAAMSSVLNSCSSSLTLPTEPGALR